MQTKGNLLTVVLIIIGIILGWFIADILKGKVPEGKVLLDQSTVDSLYAYKAFADSLLELSFEPDTIVVVETIIKEVPKYITTTPEKEIDSQDSTLTHYYDSIVVEEEIAAWIDIALRGYVKDLTVQWKYTPIVKSVVTTIEVPIPQPIITTIETPVFVTGHYLSAVAGGSDKFFTFGVDYDMVRESRIYGLQYRRQGDMSVYGFKIGINLSTIFKR